ncbi:MAG TPA: DEAD/DEAH box helicase, partial [Parasegetibacter sp.]
MYSVLVYLCSLLVMNLQELLNRFIEDPRVFQIADRISMSASQHIFLSGLHGSSAEFILSAIFKHKSTSQLNHLVVLNDAEEAAYFHNTIEGLTSALDLFYFPSSFKNRRNFRLLNSSHVMLRTETLTRLSNGGNKKIIITYPEALFEKVVLPEALSDNIIQIKTGDTIDPEKLMEKLVGYEFDRTDFVYEPGQFAVRGGILDIYSFGNEKPYRIELFGNDVDSIRIFDPETQLSERKLLQVSIIPNVENSSSIDTGVKVSLPEFLPENTIVWMKDWDVIQQKLETQLEELENFLEIPYTPREEEEDITLKQNLSKEDFVEAGFLAAELAKRHIIEFGYASTFKNSIGADRKEHRIEPGEEAGRVGGRADGNAAGSDTAGGELITLHFQTREQPAFNRQFELLIKDLTNWEKQKYTIYLFAENPKQLERLHSIFTDLKAETNFVPVPTAIHEGFIDNDLKVVCYTDHQIFQRYHKYKVKQAYNKNKAITLRTLRDLQPGDYVTHIDHGIGVYSGLQKIQTPNGRYQEAVRILYKDNDILYVNINSLHKISKYTGKEGSVPKVNKIGSDAWQKLKEKTKTRVKEIAFDLIKLYAQRKAQQGFQHSPDNYLQTELEASFIYEDTPDQSKATADVKRDMESPAPMDRLVCGDVGFGKTEVAIRAAFKTCLDGKQAAILVPTTILAFQHYKNFSERLKEFPVTVDYVNRFKSSKEKKETIEKLKEGKIDIIIGTHALLGKEVKFK